MSWLNEKHKRTAKVVIQIILVLLIIYILLTKLLLFFLPFLLAFLIASIVEKPVLFMQKGFVSPGGSLQAFQFLFLWWLQAD